MRASESTVRVERVTNRARLAHWLRVPHFVYRGDPAWVASLPLLERRRISRRRAPFFSFGDVALFVAYRGKQPVGRISAQVNYRHLARHRDGTGHFGFFDCCDDIDAARALISASEVWLRQHGLQRMLGPMSLSLNEESGCLIDGFDTPASVLMPHHGPWTGRLLELAGLTCAMDSFAFRLSPAEVPAYFFKLADRARCVSGISARKFDVRRYKEEIETIVEIFNDAWDENWGFVPLSHGEIDALGVALRPVMRGEYGRVVSIDGRPVGMVVALPNVNDLIAPLQGQLWPWNWARLLWGLRFSEPRRFRIALFGIKRVYQSTPLGGALFALLVSELLQEMPKHAIDWVELSWVLQCNRSAARLAQMVAGSPVKTYRFYAKPIL